MPDTAFPDTIIAGQIDPNKFHPQFFQDVWNGKWVRRQIEKSARTTNGTFKVNQSGLECLRIPMPDISLQKAYGEKAEFIHHQKALALNQLGFLNNLFASLQHRAFSSQL
jgi:type I restriction enzyme S subunit